MIYINITNFVVISQLKKNRSMIETGRLKNVAIFFQTIFRYTSECFGENTLMEKVGKKLQKMSYHQNMLLKYSS